MLERELLCEAVDALWGGPRSQEGYRAVLQGLAGLVDSMLTGECGTEELEVVREYFDAVSRVSLGRSSSPGCGWTHGVAPTTRAAERAQDARGALRRALAAGERPEAEVVRRAAGVLEADEVLALRAHPEVLAEVLLVRVPLEGRLPRALRAEPGLPDTSEDPALEAMVALAGQWVGDAEALVAAAELLAGDGARPDARREEQT